MANDPLLQFRFTVEWGESKMGFSEVSGLNTINAVTNHTADTNLNFYQIKTPGVQKLGNIALKRGIYLKENKVVQWLNAVPFAKVERKNLAITLFNENQKQVYVWKIKNAYPIKIVAANLKSSAQDIIIEFIEFAHEGLMIDAVN